MLFESILVDAHRGPHLGLHNAGSRGQQCKVVSEQHHVKIGNRAIQHKVVEEGWGDDRSLLHPRPHLTGNRTRCRPSKGRRCIPDVDI